MRNSLLLWCVLVVGGLLLAGCSETSGTAGAGGTAGSGGSGGIGGEGGDGGTGGVETFEYTILLTGVAPDGSNPLIEGVEACLVGTETCDTSDVTGSVTFEIPADQEFAITFDKDGYGKWVMASVSGVNVEQLFVGRRMYTDEQLEAVAAPLGVDYPWTDPIVGLVINPSETEGVTFAPVGSTAGDVGESFYYDSEAEAYDTELAAGTAVETNWNLPLGAGGFTEVTAGEQVFEFGGTAGDCEASWSWPGEASNTIRVPVIDGYRTYGSMICNGE